MFALRYNNILFSSPPRKRKNNQKLLTFIYICGMINILNQAGGKMLNHYCFRWKNGKEFQMERWGKGISFRDVADVDVLMEPRGSNGYAMRVVVSMIHQPMKISMVDDLHLIVYGSDGFGADPET